MEHPAVTPSKTALVLIESSPLASMGMDHVYMGCIKTGFLKFMLFVLVFVTPDAMPELFPIVSTFFLLWVLYDYIRVLFNALSRSRKATICENRYFSSWSSERDIIMAFWISLIFNLFGMVLFGILMITLLSSGFSFLWDSIRGNTHSEAFIPSAGKMKELLSM